VRPALPILLTLAACAHAPTRFLPAGPEYAVEGYPAVASAQASGVRVTVHAGDWQGTPSDLEERLTPVEVHVENDSGRVVRVGPEDFGLLAQNGFHYQALDPREVQRLAGPYRAAGPVYVGVYGAYPWPGFWHRRHLHPYPYAWWGWWGPPAVAYWPPPPEPPPPPPAPRGTLRSGGDISLLLFFPVPARSLSTAELTARFVDEAGAPVASVRVPLVREGAAPSRPPQDGARAPSARGARFVPGGAGRTPIAGSAGVSGR
jgi:hypothetical protein